MPGAKRLASAWFFNEISKLLYDNTLSSSSMTRVGSLLNKPNQFELNK